jgi:hypothetical protein
MGNVGIHMHPYDTQPNDELDLNRSKQKGIAPMQRAIRNWDFFFTLILAYHAR